MSDVVLGEGPTRPKLILIGEAPGEEELAEGRPFVGPSGKVLKGIYEATGLRRDDLYLDNIVPIRPPLNKIERLPELGVKVEDFIPSLLERVGKIDCKVVVALGETALQALTGYEGITKHRGSIYTMGDGKLVVPSFHPRFIIENWKMRGVVVEDIRKALRVRKEGYHEPRFNTQIKPTVSEIEVFIRQLRSTDRVSIDIETVGSGQIACIGLGGIVPEQGGRTSLCIPLKHGFNNYYTETEEFWIWSFLRELWESDLLKIGQNLNYDFSKLLPFLGEPKPPWYDLMIAHHLLEPELPHTLAFMTSLYTNPVVNYYKDDPKDEETFSWKYTTSSERLWDYNGKDVEVPLMIEPVLSQELREMGLLSFFYGYEMPLMRTMWRIQQRGMLVDEEKRSELLAIQTSKLKEKQEELNQLVGYELNVNSHPQMMKFLYEDLHLPVQRNRKTKKATSDKEALEKLIAYHPNPAFRLALDIRDSVKEIGTYLMAKTDPDGRMRGRYNVSGTATGRTSSKKSYNRTGLDWQNIPEDDRPMFIAGEGKTFLVRDLWQAEAYVVAVLSQCQAFLSRLRAGKKTHRLVASWIYGIPEDQVDSINKPGGQYYTGKRSSHGLNYGLGPVLLAVHIKSTVAEAKRIRNAYFSYAPEIEAWHLQIQEVLRTTRQLVTPFGRKRYFRDRWGEDMFKKAYAHNPQSTVAEYNHLGMIKLEYLLPEGAELVQEGFDSFIIETDQELVERIKPLIDLAFDKEIISQGIVFKIPGELTEGRRWIK